MCYISGSILRLGRPEKRRQDLPFAASSVEALSLTELDPPLLIFLDPPVVGTCCLLPLLGKKKVPQGWVRFREPSMGPFW